MHPINHGSHNNMYLLHKRRTYKIEAVVNFDSENAFTLNFKTKKDISHQRKVEIYDNIKRRIEDFDFNLKTSFDEMFVHRNKIEYNAFREQCNGR